ncbi:MAG: NAD-dependent protein deacetylase [Myxococcota bacterium]|nr:NAD-dependent protein deacetylase [Myxococcota bacterium]
MNVLRGRKIVVLTGAGCSTESGIPDYRGPETKRRARNPIKIGEFLRSEEGRRKYWARAAVGWRKFDSKRPNPAHEALAVLEKTGHVLGVITQNVDRLHQYAGSRRVVELHGALSEVRCLECGDITSRNALQAKLMKLNPHFARLRDIQMAPDGDAEVPESLVSGFDVPSCNRCGGPLKPNVVFFGESVPRRVLDDALELYGEAEALLVIGTSLAVFSGLRFVRKAAAEGMPVVMMNLGHPERGFDCVTHFWDQAAGESLPRLVDDLLV